MPRIRKEKWYICKSWNISGWLQVELGRSSEGMKCEIWDSKSTIWTIFNFKNVENCCGELLGRVKLWKALYKERNKFISVWTGWGEQHSGGYWHCVSRSASRTASCHTPSPPVRTAVCAHTYHATRLGGLVVESRTRNRQIVGSTPGHGIVGQRPWESCSHQCASVYQAV